MINDRKEIEHGEPKSFAIVSGKGGSGKTLVAVAMAQALANLQYKILLVDADFGTGGLTYYLTFTVFSNSRIGLSEFHHTEQAFSLDGMICSPRPESLDRNEELGLVRLVPTGDQRAIEPLDGQTLQRMMNDILQEAATEFDYIIVDCRGGIDPQSIGVCSSCDAIVIVAETDATSIQATQHLVDVLSKNDLKRKVRGFVLNKVMDDPIPLAKAATSFFRSEYLGSIPFDIDATRCYIQGELPKASSLFSRHVRYSLSNLLQSARSYRVTRILRSDEFSTVTLRSPETRLGGAFFGMVAIYIAVISIMVAFGGLEVKLTYKELLNLVAFGAVFYSLLVFGSLSDGMKQAVGRIFSVYRSILTKLLKGSKLNN